MGLIVIPRANAAAAAAPEKEEGSPPACASVKPSDLLLWGPAGIRQDGYFSFPIAAEREKDPPLFALFIPAFMASSWREKDTSGGEGEEERLTTSLLPASMQMAGATTHAWLCLTLGNNLAYEMFAPGLFSFLLLGSRYKKILLFFISARAIIPRKN